MIYGRVVAQPVFHITSLNIGATQSISADPSFTNASCLASLAPTYTLQASGDFLPTPNPAIITSSPSIIKATLAGISGLNLNLSGQPTIGVSTTATAIYKPTLSLLLSGQAIMMNYQINQSDMILYPWKAGNYTTSLILNITGLTLCSYSPETRQLTITVDPFINFQSTPQSSVTLTVDNLNYYRGTALSGTANFSNQYTVPLGIGINASGASLSYTPLYSGAAVVNTPVSYIMASLSSPAGGNTVSLSTTSQNVSPAAGISILAGNKQSSIVTYNISSANLKAGFLQAGNYTTTINYKAFDAGTPQQTATSVPASTIFTVHVDSLSALVLNNPNVTLSFKNTSDYTNGVDTTILGHLTLSSTVACSVTVSANTAALVNGSNSIPLDCVSIGLNGSSQKISLSTTPQTIVSGITPVIDKPLDITYSIPQNKISEIVGKPSGTYTTQLVYTLTAP